MTVYPEFEFAVMAIGIGYTVLWALYGVFGPRIIKDTRNRHNGLLVRSDGDPIVLVQEIGEWKLCKLIGTIVGVLAHIIAFQIGEVAFIFAMLAGVAADSFVRNVFALDVAGHGSEIIAGQKAGIPGYRDGELEQLLRQNNWQKALNFPRTAYKDDAARAAALVKIEAALAKWNWLAKIVFFLGKDQ